jgi:DNA-binding IclR family transcriptional regulator
VEAIAADVRARGLSLTKNMLNVGLAALAAPVFDYTNKIRGVLTIIGPSGAFSLEPSGLQAQALRESATALSARLSGKTG